LRGASRRDSQAIYGRDRTHAQAVGSIGGAIKMPFLCATIIIIPALLFDQIRTKSSTIAFLSMLIALAPAFPIHAQNPSPGTLIAQYVQTPTEEAFEYCSWSNAGDCQPHEAIPWSYSLSPAQLESFSGTTITLMAAETSFYLWLIDISHIVVTINGSNVQIVLPDECFVLYGSSAAYGEGVYCVVPTNDGWNYTTYSYQYRSGFWPYPYINALEPNSTPCNGFCWLGPFITINVPANATSVNISGWFGDFVFCCEQYPELVTAGANLYLGCPQPTIASISSSTWIVGQTYNVTITGTGFTTTANATSSCPVNTVTVTTPSGAIVALSNISVVSKTQITATVAPPIGETTETATVTVSGTPAATTTAQIIGCPSPTITSISPSTWMEGLGTLPEITGSGFITSDKATASCPMTTLTVTVPTGNVTVSNIQIESDTTISFTEVPDAKDPTETATITVGTAPNTATTTAQIEGCTFPTTEITAFQQWDPIQLTSSLWEQTISDTIGDNYSPGVVQEADAGGGVDTCYFAGSPFQNRTILTGGQWNVNSDNTWGPDNVGWLTQPLNAVTYYRTQGKAPCGFALYQQMQMQCPDNTWHNYGIVNTLQSNITTKTITSMRAGGTATRRY